jgi:hypothetical protein
MVGKAGVGKTGSRNGPDDFQPAIPFGSGGTANRRSVT